MKFRNLILAIMAINPLIAEENGLVGHYFDNTRLLGAPVVTTVDLQLNFAGNEKAPIAGVPENFSARWSGEVLPTTTGSYEISVRSDDGVRVWIAQQLVIDQWLGNAPTVFSGSVDLQADVRVPIVIEYFDDHGGATLQLSWRPPGGDLAIIPSTALFPTNPFVPNGQASLPSAPTAGLRLPAVIRSATSPAYLDVARSAGATVSTISWRGGIVTTPINGVLTGVNIPLSSLGTTRVIFMGGGRSYSRLAHWTPTHVAGDGEKVIRVGDALLLRAGPGSLAIDPECGVGESVPVLANKPVPRTFSQPGNFVVRSLTAAGEEVGRIRVTVIGNPLSAEPTAIEIANLRRYDLTSQPNPALIAIMGNDPALLAVPHYEFGAAATGDVNGIRILAQPLARGDLKLVARVKSTGALLGVRAVDEYTITSDFDAAHGYLYTRDAEGFGHGRIGFTMDPVVPYSAIQLDAYVPTFTMNGASTVTVPASELDANGHWDTDMVMNRGRPLTCHRITVIAQ